MDNLIIIAGIFAAIRAFWVYNLLREESGHLKGSVMSFLEDKNKFSMYLLIRPFKRKMKNERLRKKINIITFVIYICFIIGIVSIIR